MTTGTTPTATEWFARPLRSAVPASTALPVLCLPYAGGGASAFRGWAEAFAPQLDIRAVKLPGRESRWAEEPVIDPVALAEAIAETIDGDYLVYGHSMGARLGYETIRALAQSGGPLPRRLIVGGCPPPHLRLDGDLKDLSRRSDEEMIQRLAALGGMPQEVLDSPELVELLLPAIRADFTWIDDYRWQPGPPLPVPITVVCGRTDGVCLPPTGIGWSRHSAPGFRLRTVEGSHFFLHERFGALGALIRAEAYGDPRDDRPVAPGTLRLWLADLDSVGSAALARWERDAPDEERAHAARFARESDALRFRGRRGIVRDVLAHIGSDAPVHPGEHHKPYCPDGPELSWSHRDGQLLLGLATTELGVDVERSRVLEDLDALARSCLHPLEIDALQGLAPQDRPAELLRAWTAKEALLKSIGTGLSIDPVTIDLQQADPEQGVIGASPHHGPAVVRPTHAPDELVTRPREVVVVELPHGPGAVAAQHLPDIWSVDDWLSPLSDARSDEQRTTGGEVVR